MSWDNPTDIEMGICRPNGVKYADTECEECDHSEAGEANEENPVCSGCIYNPKYTGIDFIPGNGEDTQETWNGFELRSDPDPDPEEPDDE